MRADPRGFIMATMKQPKSKNGRTALNMTVVVVTSESVLLFLLAAKALYCECAAEKLQSSLILSVQVKTQI
jgi:hypothetical protein